MSFLFFFNFFFFFFFRSNYTSYYIFFFNLYKYLFVKGHIALLHFTIHVTISDPYFSMKIYYTIFRTTCL